MAREEFIPKVYQILVTLNESSPSIWRRIWVEGDFDLQELHFVIQLAMGWNDIHFYSYMKDGADYSFNSSFVDEQDEEFEFTEFLLEELLKKENQKMTYFYGWEKQFNCDILVEKIFDYDESKVYPVCLEGANACPPDDCPSMARYYEALEEYKTVKPGDANYQENIDRFGENFNPFEFDIEAVNENLKPED